jgi:hypothetical protein
MNKKITSISLSLLLIFQGIALGGQKCTTTSTETCCCKSSGGKCCTKSPCSDNASEKPSKSKPTEKSIPCSCAPVKSSVPGESALYSSMTFYDQLRFLFVGPAISFLDNTTDISYLIAASSPPDDFGLYLPNYPLRI